MSLKPYIADVLERTPETLESLSCLSTPFLLHFVGQYEFATADGTRAGSNISYTQLDSAGSHGVFQY